MVEAGTTLASMELQAAYTMAREMLNSHGLHEWDLAYDRARRRAGLTNFTTGTISLSRPLTQLFSEEDVRETVLHEIAHALVGPGHNHDALWKREAARIGATPRALLSGGPQVPARYIGHCPNGHVIMRHRIRRNPVSCAKCCPDFDPEYLIEWYDTKEAPRYSGEDSSIVFASGAGTESEATPR